MKLNSPIIASLSLAAMVMSGCAMEEFGNELEGVDFVAPKISAELAEEPATRTCIDADALVAGEKATVLWCPEDQIGVFSTGSSNVLYINDEKEECVPNTSFSGTANVSGDIQYAYYPHNAANNGRKANNLVGTVPTEQRMGQSIPGDYKYGELKSVTEDGGYKFKFHNLFSVVRINLNAQGSAFEGKLIESVTLTVTRGENNTPVPVAGEFTFDATKKTTDEGSKYTLGTTSNTLMTVWNKAIDGTLTHFATVFPEIKTGDKLSFAVRTEDKTMTFNVTSKVDFKPETFYTFPLTLSGFAAKPDACNYNLKDRPVLKSLKFEVSKNSGKLLNNKTTWNSSKHTASFSSASEHTSTITGNEAKTVIPYLYNFNLVPTFDAGNCTIEANGETITSGQTSMDFTQPVTFTVRSTDDWRDYTVKVCNSGLPVVVLKQSGSGNFDKVYNGGFQIFGQQIGGTLVNEFVGIRIRGKDTDWVEDDQMTVYNPDGTVNMVTTTCGARLRGNTSQVYPKKPFAVKLTSKQSILGMPAHKRWVLLANWLDHSMIRNAVAFDIAHAIENAWKTGAIEPGIPWNVHGQNVELVFVESNGKGHHVGNYYLCEQIKIDKNRLKIKDPYEDVVADGNANPGIGDCGYLFEVDGNYDEVDKFKTSKNVPFMFKDEVSDGILSAVKTKVQNIETNIYKNTTAGFDAAFTDLDINSVIDQMLIFELTMNREYGDPRSVYMFMDGDGKLSGGPVWDFDRGTFQNPTKAETLCDNNGPKGSSGKYYRIKSYNEWLYWRDGTNQETDTYSYVWYRGLAKSAAFQAKVQERWAVIKPYLEMVAANIQAYGTKMAISYEYDSAMWPTTKEDIRKYKDDFNDWSGDETIASWEEIIDNFATVYQARLDGMDGLITSGKFTK